ncbi:MAG TPA: hypothetical protein VGK13_05250 [Methanocellaceae archaeon]
MGLSKDGTFIVLCVILYVIVSGCLDQDIYGNKGPRTIQAANDALNATIAVWNSSGHNSTIDNSSIYLTNVNMIGKETRISTYQFNTTDGKSHTVNVSDYNATHPVVMDIDSISIAYPDPTQINFIANPYLDTTGGMYSMNLTAYVYDASGNPVVDGTVVNFNINEPDVIFNGGTPTNSPYNPFISGSLNGNNSQYVSISTGSGKAVVRYGWFPDNRIPSGFVKITAMINNTPSVNSTLYLIFNGTTQVWWTIVPTMRP